jgi:citrate synthase
VAGAALRFGDPVLDSAITEVRAKSPRYRGHAVTELVKSGATFESVAEILWGSDPPVERWPSPRMLARVPYPDAPPVWRLVQALPGLALADTARHSGTAAMELDRARRLLRALAGALVGAPISIGSRIAEGIAATLTMTPLQEATRAVDAILVACADHELNVSTFTARVAASAGADLYAAVGAGLYSFTGPRHGAACDRIEALVSSCETRGTQAVVDELLALGQSIPGFGHPLYPDGDPRTPPLLAVSRRKPERSALIDELVRIVSRETGAQPAVDLGVVAVTRALGAERGLSTALFALGRAAGWVAHVLEQRRDGAILRPRARYVGPE